MKLKNEHLERFKDEFKKWQEAFGLTEYKAYFKWGDDPREYASINIDEDGKVCMVVLGRSYEKEDVDAPEVELHAKHECIHLLLHRLIYQAKCRWVREEEIDDEWERLTRKLERVL